MANFKAKSMLEKMGFVDEDLKCPAHDAMSFALAGKDFSSRLLMDAVRFKEKFLWKVSKIQLEYPIRKGEGKFSTIVGYADARIGIDLYEHGSDQARRVNEGIFIEAKPSLPNPMETLRQIKTYKEIMYQETRTHYNSYGKHSFLDDGIDHIWVLWCPGLSEEVASIFRQQGVRTSNIAHG